MTETAANALISRTERASRWPPPFETEAHRRIVRYAAFRESDVDALRVIHHWPESRRYVPDPLGELIAVAKADLLFGEDPKVTPAADSDAANLDRIVQVSDLPSELHWAEQIRSSEGEVWWRLMSTPELLDAPLITFHSREVVIPLFVGSSLIAAGFVSEFEDAPATEGSRPVVWRHLEIQSVGRVENRLYRGDPDHLGELQGLDAHSETAELEPVWDTGIPLILAGRVVHRRGRDRRVGRSVYAGREDLLLALNEAVTIGAENARLAGKKRAVVPPETLKARRPEDVPASIDAGDGSRIPVSGAEFDAGEDVLVAGGALDGELGKEGSGPFKILEYSFDAEAIVTWQNALVKTLASRCGLTVAFLGVGDDLAGQAATGTALRVRLLPATSSAEGSARSWDDALPQILLGAQLLDALPQSARGFGRPWSKSGEAPAVERTDPLPRDETEETGRLSTAVGGPIVSTRQAVKELHPDWSDDQVDEEVGLIRGDVQTSNRLLGLGSPPAPDETGADEPPGPGPPAPEQQPGEAS